MTDKEVADKIYIEPLTIEFIEKNNRKRKTGQFISWNGWSNRS